MRVKWTFDKLKQEALAYASKIEFLSNSPSAYQTAHKLNLLDSICGHMNRPNKKWTIEELEKEALKYKTKNEFKLGNSTAYSLARRHKVLSKICKHMSAKYKTWSEEEVYAVAAQYNTRLDFKKKNRSAYNYAVSRNILEDVCEHMKRSSSFSSYESELFEEIKLHYPTATKFRMRGITIESKPYIKGFDVDIFIPELNKGIEFDGDYWHSEQGIAYGRPSWPKEELENYHKIKDDYFKSRGIVILHVSETEWKENKTLVIHKCLEFLK